MSKIDRRLIEHVAACLCWAEWSSLDDRTDDPWTYWQSVSAEAKTRYYRDARHIAAAMRPHGGYVVVPQHATAEMRETALNAARGLRSATGAADVWDQMVDCAQDEMKWRSGDVDPEDRPAGAITQVVEGAPQ